MIKFILIVIFSLLFTYFTAKIDDVHQEKEEYITNHTNRWFQRLISVCLVSVLDVYYGALFGLIFWFSFDQIKNRIGVIKQPLFYLGSVSNSDTFFRNNLFLYLLLKIFLLTIIIYISWIKLR